MPEYQLQCLICACAVLEGPNAGTAAPHPRWYRPVPVDR
ncbi:hypothetical protein FTUN_4122 [Frigoriglobus tundricola]|uniref:Uncharacterized protein n=1 Tax=Frigoriglobus tundricola TaxID=2774151 RepID=A0A6M5YR87_9BACT|nr:hypothetical protein FTUN_4122 [Frigoriglobus tundricola]